MLFKNVANLWLQIQNEYIKLSTLARYEIAIVNHLISKFGSLEIKDLNQIELQNVVNYWKNN